MKKLLCLLTTCLAVTALQAQPVITRQPVAEAEFTPNGFANPTTYNSLSSLYLGNSADLTVQANGALSYHWTFNGTPIPGATATNFALSNIQVSQAGIYACVVSNASGMVTSSVVTVQPWQQVLLSAPTAFSTDSVLTQAGTPIAANAFGGTAETVTVSGTGQVITFEAASGAVATVNQAGTFNGFAGTVTGNANFDAVLDEGSYDGPITAGGNPCKIVTMNSLTPGNPYSVLLIGLDDRGCCDTRTAAFQDACDLGNETSSFQLGANDYVLASFIAGGTSETINEILGDGSGNMMCVAVYALTNAPQFTGALTALPSQTNFAGVEVTLSPTTLLGQFPFSYQWQLNGTNLAGQTQSVLTLADTATNQSGNYQLVVSNSSGVSTSAPIALVINPAAAPLFLTNVIQPPTLFLNDTVSLVSTVAGTPPIALQWQQNGVNIPGATNATLTLQGLQPGQSGVYMLVATNQFGKATNNPVTLSVEPYEQFTWGEPIPITTANATLGLFGETNYVGASDFANGDESVTLSDTIAPTINFTANNEFTGAGVVYASTTGGFFQNGFSGIWNDTSGNASFDAVLSGIPNGISANNGPVTLTFYQLTPSVLYAVQLFAVDQRSCCGSEQVYFQDPAYTNNASATLTLNQADYVVGTFVANETNQTITAQMPDGGDGVLNGAVIYALPQGAVAWEAPTASPSTTVDSGVVVTFSDAFVTGIPPFIYQWQSNGTNIPNATNATLTLTLTNPNNNASITNDYSLIVANSQGSSTSAPTAVTINPASPPTFSGSLTQPPILFLNDSLSLSSGISGTPPIVLQWKLNGISIPGATNATLTYQELQSGQSGVYTLVASNAFGLATNGPITVTIEPYAQFAWSPPVPITTADATLDLIGTLVGAVDFGGEDTTVSLTNGANIDFTGDTSVASVTGDGNGNFGFFSGATTGNSGFDTVLNGADYDGVIKTITINNLTPGALYAVQLFAVEDRWGDQDGSLNEPIAERQIYFQDPNDTNNISAIYTEGANDYVICTFTANATNQVIVEQLPGIPGDANSSGSGNANALVLYSVPQGASAWMAPAASPADTVLAGTTVTLSDPAVTGIPPISYQWQTNGVDIPGATNSVLVLSNVALLQPTNYTVVVANSEGTNTSPPMSLSVVTEPTLGTNGAGWSTNGGAIVANSLLTLTDGNTGESRSAFFQTPVYVGAFNASFIYQVVNPPSPEADGFTLCLQNCPGGAAAYSGGGGSLADVNLIPSVALAFNIYDGNTLGYALVANGEMSGSGPIFPNSYAPYAPVSLGSGDPISVNINYNGDILELSLTDLTSSASFATNIPVGPISSVLGGDTALVGFTAASGGFAATQTVSNFVFSPVPMLSTTLAAGNNVVIAWPGSIGGYVLQSTTNLEQSWTNVPLPYVSTNGEFQVTVPSNGRAFYRLAVSLP